MKRNCPECKTTITYVNRESFRRACKSNPLCSSCGRKGDRNPVFGLSINMGKRPQWHKDNISNGIPRVTRSEEYRQEQSDRMKTVMHRPDVRQKHMDALQKSKWIKVKCDIGQLELLEKWNKLGFKFESNFQLRTENDLFYIDGYDVENNVVLEFDSKYHHKPYVKVRDEVRQQKIIDTLKPKVFWRYDSVSKTFCDVYRNRVSN